MCRVTDASATHIIAALQLTIPRPCRSLQSHEAAPLVPRVFHNPFCTPKQTTFSPVPSPGREHNPHHHGVATYHARVCRTSHTAALLLPRAFSRSILCAHSKPQLVLSHRADAHATRSSRRCNLPCHVHAIPRTRPRFCFVGLSHDPLCMHDQTAVTPAPSIGHTRNPYHRSVATYRASSMLYLHEATLLLSRPFPRFIQ